MFLRRWSALPAEAEFPSDLKGLGYFVNKDDEVRSIENEDNYFKFFINRNLRVCDRQCFAMNQAIQAVIHERLVALGLGTISLPFHRASPSDPSVPIFATPNLLDKSRVVIIFGETHQDLGVLAHRVLGGPGGIDKGSLVSVVRAILQQRTSSTDPSPPGIILANMGELIWWPEGRRTLNRFAFDAAPMRSAAHVGNYIDLRRNFVRDHATPMAHVKYILDTVVSTRVNPRAGLDIIGLGDGADVVERYLNCDATWARVGKRINCFASVGGQFPAWQIECAGLREFLKDRARAYAPSTETLGVVLSGSSGNPDTTTFTSLGCPVFSAGEPNHVETLFIASHRTVLDWLQEVADTPTKKKPYVNPDFTVAFSDAPDGDFDGNDWNMESPKDDSVMEQTVEELDKDKSAN
ncbi:Arb2 domain-containing protein [Xylaria arbuscula]|nr:Arb2 domain-containing protein [Xylaria arbuscula]